MSKGAATIIAGGAGAVACAVGWFMLPALQSSQSVVEAEASVELERARRLLHEYDSSLAYKSLLTDGLEREGIEIDAAGLSDDALDEYQASHTAMWKAYPPNDWPPYSPNPRPARPGYADVPGQIRQALTENARFVAENGRLLEQALSAVERALSITVGGESSRSHAEANRLKSAILEHMGLARRIEARLHRRRGSAYRRELMVLSARARAAQSAGTLASDSGIEEQIDTLRAKVSELESAVRTNRDSVASLDARIDALQVRLWAARSRRDEALDAMQELKTEGIDFSDPTGAEKFRNRLEELDELFRNADREARAIEFGDYARAEIDPRGDFLTGRYLEGGAATDLTIEFGLKHFQEQRDVLAAELEARERALAGFQDDMARLRRMKEAFAGTQQNAAQRVGEAAGTASELYTELNRVEAEAFTIEDKALDLLKRSAAAARQAAVYADAWIRDARDRTRRLSPEAKARSAFGARLRDVWMKGYIAAQEADAHLAQAWIHYERYRAFTRSVDVLTKVADVLKLREADIEGERDKVRMAHDAGVEEVKAAMDVLKGAHRNADNHWTIAAQAAGTTYLLALFGHQDYVNDTIEAYQNAVKGRESETFAQPFVARISRLQRDR